MDDVVATFSLYHSAIWFEDVIMFVLWKHSHVPNIPRLNTRIILNYGHSVGCYSVQTTVISNTLHRYTAKHSLLDLCKVPLKIHSKIRKSSK